MNHSSYGAVTLEQKYDGHLCVTRSKSVAHQWRCYIFGSLRIFAYSCSNQLVTQKRFVETLKLRTDTFDGRAIAQVVWWEATCLQTTSLWLKGIVISLHQCAQLACDASLGIGVLKSAGCILVIFQQKRKVADRLHQFAGKIASQSAVTTTLFMEEFLVSICKLQF